MRILLDTNIIVAGLISPTGPPAKLIRAWLSGRFELVTAREQFDELSRVLNYRHLRPRISAVQKQEFLGNIDVLAVVATDLPSVNSSRDPADNVILAIAIASEADLIVSGDKPDVLALGDVGGIPIRTAKEALRTLGLSEE